MFEMELYSRLARTSSPRSFASTGPSRLTLPAEQQQSHQRQPLSDNSIFANVSSYHPTPHGERPGTSGFSRCGFCQSMLCVYLPDSTQKICIYASAYSSAWTSAIVPSPKHTPKARRGTSASADKTYPFQTTYATKYATTSYPNAGPLRSKYQTYKAE